MLPNRKRRKNSAAAIYAQIGIRVAKVSNMEYSEGVYVLREILLSVFEGRNTVRDPRVTEYPEVPDRV